MAISVSRTYIKRNGGLLKDLLRYCRTFCHHVENTSPNLPGKKNAFNSLEKVKFLRKRGDVEDDSKIASRICLSVVGNGAIGQPRCLGLFTDQTSYMFNCGEGAMRILRKTEGNFLNVKHIFVTEKSWENICGIADVYLTNQGYGMRKITLHGPHGLDKYQTIVTSEKFLAIKIKRGEDLCHNDDTLNVEYVPIFKSSKMLHRSLKIGSNINLLNKNPNMGDNLDYVVSYICRIHPKPGQFLVEKCAEHGVPLGPLLVDLKNGASIVLPSGKMIHPRDVHEAELPGTIFLVVDCPQESMISTFTAEEKFQFFHLPSNLAADVSAVFHFSPAHVVNSYAYQAWMKKFHPNTLHFLLNSVNSTLNSDVIHQIQHTLHLLHPRIFPLINEQPKSPLPNALEDMKIIQPEPLLKLNLRPDLQLDRSNVVHLNPDLYVEYAKNVDGFSDHLTQLHNVIMTNEHLFQEKETFSAEYPEVIFLGTASSTSTIFRNVTGILVNLSPDRRILLDCGDGIYTQLLRYFGYQNICSVLQSISCIFISHQHTDHYFGLFSLLKARKQAFMSSSKPYQPVALMLNRVLEPYILRFNKHFSPIKSDFRIFQNAHIGYGGYYYNELKQFLGDVDVIAVPVLHCTESCGLVMSTPDWKIVYSGDAAPTQALVDAGQNCNLLIHEASVEDGLSNEAAYRRHSTSNQALEVGQKMNAEYTILTHFSKRYLAIPIISETENSNFGCAFDFMTVRLGDLPLLPKFIPVLKCLFSDHLKSYEERTIATTSVEKVFWKSQTT